MADSLRDQLLKSGIVKQLREDPSAKPNAGNQPAQARSDKRRKQAGKPRKGASSPDEIDLARAYALRARTDADERRQAQAEAAAKAQARKQRHLKLQQALEGHALNKPDAELLRHFEFGGKIRRVHVDAAQLAALNAGELGVVQHGGRHVLVERAVAMAISEFAPEQVALLVDPDASPDDDGIPSDLVW